MLIKDSKKSEKTKVFLTIFMEIAERISSILHFAFFCIGARPSIPLAKPKGLLKMMIAEKTTAA
jgi:hypothetical protein